MDWKLKKFKHFISCPDLSEQILSLLISVDLSLSKKIFLKTEVSRKPHKETNGEEWKDEEK